jgi:CBS-domain-containing membrane protein
MQAKDVMTMAVVTARPQTSVEEIAKLMLDRRISAIPVVDANGRVQGIVSEGDLIRRVETGTEVRRRSWWLEFLAGSDGMALDYLKSHGRTAGDVMTREVVTIGERTPLEKIATLLERHRIKRVPVVRNGKVVGIVSRANLLHGLAAQKTGGGTSATTDRAIRARVLKDLEEAGVHKLYVNVVVTKGVVELWGFVETDAQKRALEVATKNARGVKRVLDNVSVISPRVRVSMGAQ